MTAALVVGCSLLGLLVGLVLPVVIARVPEKVPVLAGPFPEAARSVRTPLGWLIAAGPEKADSVGAAFSGDETLPAARATGAARTVWLLDREAATKVPSDRLP